MQQAWSFARGTACAMDTAVHSRPDRHCRRSRSSRHCEHSLHRRQHGRHYRCRHCWHGRRHWRRRAANAAGEEARRQAGARPRTAGPDLGRSSALATKTATSLDFRNTHRQMEQGTAAQALWRAMTTLCLSACPLPWNSWACAHPAPSSSRCSQRRRTGNGAPAIVPPSADPTCSPPGHGSGRPSP